MHKHRRARRRLDRRLPADAAVARQAERAHPLRRAVAGKALAHVRLVRGDREAFGLHGRSAEQRVALAEDWTGTTALVMTALLFGMAYSTGPWLSYGWDWLGT